MGAEALQNRLFRAAEASAAKRGVRFGGGAEMDIRGFAAKGADDIKSLPVNAQEPKILEAESAFDRLVENMVGAAKSTRGLIDSHSDIIGEETLAAAKLMLCPLWPIC
jgi:hypothetical protein